MSKKNSIIDILNKLVNKLPERQKEVVASRFGILGKKYHTLAKLGSKHGITRERVRQIESASLKKLKKDAKEIKEVVDAYENLVSHVKSVGGTRKVKEIVKDAKAVLKDEGLREEYVNLLFRIFDVPVLFKESNDFYSFWYTSKEDMEKNKKFVKDLVKEFTKNKKKVVEDQEHDKILKTIANKHSIPHGVALNFIRNSKKFSVSVFGDFGLSHWPEILPKTIKNKVYIVLKKEKNPMHFVDIAKKIKKANFDEKNVHPQTIHNELIKDNRFVLVGRGLYSLKEFGIEPGTTKEIMQKILKKNGPLHSDKIMELVSQQRLVKKNTISINLHNKKHFKKLEDGRYHIA